MFYWCGYCYVVVPGPDSKRERLSRLAVLRTSPLVHPPRRGSSVRMGLALRGLLSVDAPMVELARCAVV